MAGSSDDFMKLKGGRLQRKRLLEQDDMDKEVSDASVGGTACPLHIKLDSEFAEELVAKWTKGEISATKVQHDALKVYNDFQAALTKAGVSMHYIPNSLKALAHLGSKGKLSGNINTELKAWLGEPDVPPPQMFFVPVKTLKARKSLGVALQYVKLPFLLPHILFAHLFHNMRDEFNFKMFGPGGTEEKLTDFWSEVVARKDPKIKSHPMCTKSSWIKRAIPILLHGDSVPVVNVARVGTKSLDCISWRSLFACGATMAIKIWIFGVFDQCKVKLPGVSTMGSAWEIIVWSLKSLYQGVHPMTDWNGAEWTDEYPAERTLAGTPLCSKRECFFGVIWGINADLDWNAKELDMNKYNSLNPCSFCPATADIKQPKKMWCSCFTNAAWKKMVYKPLEWRAAHGNLHILFVAFEFLSCLNVEPDELHILYLGTVQYLLGSVLWLLVYDVLEGSPQANLQKVWKMIIEEYQSIGTLYQFSSMQISFFAGKQPHNSYPQLKGRGCQVKGLINPLLNVWKKVMVKSKRSVVYKNNVLKALQAQHTVQKIIDDHHSDVFITKDQVPMLQQAIDDHLEAYSWLALESDKKDEMLFTVAPKFHFLWHLGQRAVYLNPRRAACFIDEDFVKHMKKLCSKCLSNRPLHLATIGMMDKYRYGLTLEKSHL